METLHSKRKIRHGMNSDGVLFTRLYQKKTFNYPIIEASDEDLEKMRTENLAKLLTACREGNEDDVLKAMSSKFPTKELTVKDTIQRYYDIKAIELSKLTKK